MSDPLRLEASDPTQPDPYLAPEEDAEALKKQQQALEQAVFLHALKRLTPHAFVTYGLLVINAAVFVAMVVDGVSAQQPSIEALIKWGANYGPRTSMGEPWRLLSCAFVHIGFAHVAMNMWVLRDAGPLVERLLGNVPFALMYVAAGLAGSLASLATHPHMVSAGASGAVFGVIGALLAVALKHGRSIPAPVLRRLRTSGVFFVVVNTALSLTIEGIDIAAHSGGLVGGFLVALPLSRPIVGTHAPSRFGRMVAVVLASGLALVAAINVLPKHPVDSQLEIGRLTELDERVSELGKSFNRKETSAASLARALDREVLPAWAGARERLSQVEGFSSARARHVEKLLSYAEMKEDAWQLLVVALRTDDTALFDRANKKSQAAGAILGDGPSDD